MARWRDIFEKILIADIEYFLQTNQVIHKDIAPPHLYERIGAAAERGTQDLQSGDGLFLCQPTGEADSFYVLSQYFIPQEL